MSASDYLENKVLDHVFGGPDFLRPATIFMALYSAAPGDTGGGTELTGNGYVRTSISNGTTTWNQAAAGAKVNAALIITSVATANWATVTHVGFWDAVTAGNFITYGALASSIIVPSGDYASFAPGSISITLD